MPAILSATLKSTGVATAAGRREDGSLAASTGEMGDTGMMQHVATAAAVTRRRGVETTGEQYRLGPLPSVAARRHRLADPGGLPSHPMKLRAIAMGMALTLTLSCVSGRPTSAAARQCPQELATRQDRRGSWICRTVDGRRAWRQVPQPTVTNRLPFDPTPPSGPAEELLQHLVTDVSALWNCNSGLMDRCARAVWGRRDPWNLPRVGLATTYNRPWVALWSKYASSGVGIAHEDGPFTAEFPGGTPQLSFFYVATIDGRRYGLEISSADDVAYRDPSTWFVPNCPSCRGYRIIPLP